MTDKILLVDDEPRALEGFRAVLQRAFNLRTAVGPESGLEILRSTGPYAVVVSDLKMPGMDGIEFLARVREISPDTVRVMLTGHADMESAIAAVNTGEVFRFHTKPCPAAVLRQTLRDSLDRYRTALMGPGVEAPRPATPETSGPSEPGAKDGAPRVSDLSLLLTSKELRVVDLIRRDATSKEIAQIMDVSARTVESHRENIRRKLGLANAKVNLQSYLKSLPG